MCGIEIYRWLCPFHGLPVHGCQGAGFPSGHMDHRRHVKQEGFLVPHGDYSCANSATAGLVLSRLL